MISIQYRKGLILASIIVILIIILFSPYQFFLLNAVDNPDPSTSMVGYDQGDVVIIRSVTIDEIKLGDIVVFNGGTENNPRYKVHQVIYRAGDNLLIKGDNPEINVLPDAFNQSYEIPYEMIVGIVVGKIDMIGAGFSLSFNLLSILYWLVFAAGLFIIMTKLQTVTLKGLRKYRFDVSLVVLLVMISIAPTFVWSEINMVITPNPVAIQLGEDIYGESFNVSFSVDNNFGDLELTIQLFANGNLTHSLSDPLVYRLRTIGDYKIALLLIISEPVEICQVIYYSAELRSPHLPNPPVVINDWFYHNIDGSKCQLLE